MIKRQLFVGLFALSPALVVAEEVFDLGGVARLGLSGFVKGEVSRGTNLSQGQVNCVYTPDPRGVLGVFPDGGGPYCQPGASRTSSPASLRLWQLTADLTKEFDSAWKIGARVGYRNRNGDSDIPGDGFVDKNLAVSHPIYGEARVGTQLSRSWSRSDSFSYPIGISAQWSETGAGYGLLSQSARYTSAQFEAVSGKWVVEGTLATNKVRYAASAPYVGYDQAPPKPKLGEIFVQYAHGTQPLLVEYIFQSSSGGIQSSWAKGGFVGDVGNADNLANYKLPKQNVHIVQGDYYPTPKTKLTFGGRRSYWSGSVYQCDYSASVGGCLFPAGFNNGTDLRGHSATSYDFMGGMSYIDVPYTYHASFVRLNKARTSSPTEYGQSNSALSLNLGISRKIPEIYKGVSVYSGLGYVRFGTTGPAPISMPTNTAWGVDPRSKKSGVTLTLGVNLVL